jgi:hypothetical protein
MNSKFCTILVVLSSLWACNTPEGFTEGAFLRVHNGSEENVVIVFSNADGLSDSVACPVSVMTQIPMDMYSPRMDFKVKEENRNSTVRIGYTTAVAKKVLGLKLNLENITAVLDTAVNDHVFMRGETFDQETAFKNTDYPLSAESSWVFINEVSGVLWIE